MLLQLATERQKILESYNNSDQQIDRLIEIETAIIAEPHPTEAAKQIKRDIIKNQPDFADLFIQRLALSLC